MLACRWTRKWSKLACSQGLASNATRQTSRRINLDQPRAKPRYITPQTRPHRRRLLSLGAQPQNPHFSSISNNTSDNQLSKTSILPALTAHLRLSAVDMAVSSEWPHTKLLHPTKPVSLLSYNKKVTLQTWSFPFISPNQVKRRILLLCLVVMTPKPLRKGRVLKCFRQ